MTTRTGTNRFVLLIGVAVFAFVLGFLQPTFAQLASFYSRDSWIVTEDDRALIPAYPNAALAAALAVGGYKGHPDRPFTVKAASFRVSVAGGGGGGSTVVTVTDGTNTCLATLLCTTSAAAGVYRVATTNGAGTGCSYAKGAGITASVTTAGCTTTQPTVNSLLVLGRWEE